MKAVSQANTTKSATQYVYMLTAGPNSHVGALRIRSRWERFTVTIKGSGFQQYAVVEDLCRTAKPSSYRLYLVTHGHGYRHRLAVERAERGFHRY